MLGTKQQAMGIARAMNACPPRLGRDKVFVKAVVKKAEGISPLKQRDAAQYSIWVVVITWKPKQ